MPTSPLAPTSSSTAPRPGDPDSTLLEFVSGTLLQVGTQATGYVSSFVLAPSSALTQSVPA